MKFAVSVDGDDGDDNDGDDNDGDDNNDIIIITKEDDDDDSDVDKNDKPKKIFIIKGPFYKTVIKEWTVQRTMLQL